MLCVDIVIKLCVIYSIFNFVTRACDEMATKILTIAIPTYNRSAKLGLLLETLTTELSLLVDSVEVIVGDNSSSDNTKDITEAFQKACPNVKVLRHSRNVGPEENFCLCIESVKTKYFWLIGDDDLPKKNVISDIVNFLQNHETDLLYVPSEWMPNIRSSTDGSAIANLSYRHLNSGEFAKELTVWLTFISGIIVNLRRFKELNPDFPIRQFMGTSLVQLGWVLPMVIHGRHFHVINEKAILATSGNTGGYELFYVFGKNLGSILDEYCGSSSYISKAVISNLVWTYIPGLIVGYRFSRVGSFSNENIIENLKGFKNYLAYWLVLLPVAVLPRPAALFANFLGKAIYRVIKR